MIGRTLGHYLITEKLGEGGMGVVYKARDARLDRYVVLKILRDDQTGDPARRRRFLQEALAASALSSPNIITIHDIAQEDQLEYIVMEYVNGQPLDFLIPSGGMAPSQAVRYAVQIADALDAAHNAGIIHRDLKPANVMVAQNGLVKLLDFGLAKLTSAWAGAALTGPVTIQGSIIGTVCYMSPEQALAQPLDARADIFSFGTLLYEMLTGRRAFGDASSFIAMTAVVRDTPPPPSRINFAVQPELTQIVMKCLAKQPDDRYSSAAEVRRALLSLHLRDDPENAGVRDPCGEGHRALRSLSSASLAKARACFELAVREGSDEAAVWEGMSEYYSQVSLLGMGEPAEVLPKAIWAAKKAIDRDPGSEGPRLTLALLRANHEYVWNDVRRSISNISSYAGRYRQALWYLRPTGRFDEAEAAVQQDHAARAWLSLERGDLTAAARHASTAELESWLGCWVQAWTFLANGRARQALETCQGALRLEPGNPWLESALATALAMQKHVDAARKLIGQPHWKPASFPIPALIALGEADRAFTAAERALRRRDPGLITVLRLPLMQPFRNDSRYRDLHRAMNLG
jgi:serine/threonine protein kinase